jgi:hypothetical protein
MNKRAFILVCLLCITAIVISAEWFPFTKEAQLLEKPKVAVLTSDRFSVSLKTEVFGIEWKVVDSRSMVNTKGEAFSLWTI